MKPKLYVKNFAMTALGGAHAAHQLSASSLIRSSNPQKSSAQESCSPYPGICICSASELLDFGFENAEILQGRED
jgi:hypothetical protein